MGFIVKNNISEPIVRVEDNGYNGVEVYVGDTCVVGINKDGELTLVDYVDPEEVGDLKLTDGVDDGWGDKRRRARIFFEGEELILPSEIKAAEKKAAAKTKKVA